MKNKYFVSATLALAIIVKDAEDTIENAILSAKDLCNQIVVLDTGSSDSTPIICSRLGAELHFLQWNDSFSEARNHLLKYIRTDWILSLDADEELEPDSLLKYRFLLEDVSIGGIRTKIINTLDNGKTASEHYYPRLFRNLPDNEYVGKIHEQISDSILNQGYEIKSSCITIYHYGYDFKDPVRISRNKKMIKEELENSPEDPWLMYHLAETEFADNNHKKAYEYFSQIFISPELSAEQREISMIRLAQIALKKNDINSVLKWTEFKSRDTNREGLRKYVRAAGKLIAQNLEDAMRLYNSKDVNDSVLIDKEQLEKAKELVKSMSLFR
jgi:glycosyltransferase involved in cell wall biosynthesis